MDPGIFLDAFVIYAGLESGQYRATFIGYLPGVLMCVKATSALVGVLKEWASENEDQSELQAMRE
ncbi:MAG: hypothetical protein LBV23_00585 [Deltaproteobacteria bacterium]|jgi:hypothetical protein|nr:hypothetical protein [Deltaproteobacteria bacterium]